VARSGPEPAGERIESLGRYDRSRRPENRSLARREGNGMRRLILAFMLSVSLALGASLALAGVARASSSAVPTDGACPYWQQGFYKAVNGYIYQCQYIPGIGWMWVLIGYVHCGPAMPTKQNSPSRCV